MNTTKCSICGSNDVRFFIGGKAYCQKCMRKAKEGRPFKQKPRDLGGTD